MVACRISLLPSAVPSQECFLSQGESDPERGSHAGAPDLSLGGISKGCSQLGCGPRALLIRP